jgi:ubiquinone/menaquinone biosynthesis C-methylase UbiE
MHKHERMFHHHHAQKLDDPERRKWLPEKDVLDRLALRAEMIVADIGAGTGYLALPIARVVSRVVAVDMQPEMLEILRSRIGDLPIETVRGEATKTTLDDASVDLALLANVWHELDDHDAALAEIQRILRSHGRVAILDWRPDVDPVSGPPLDLRIAPEKTEAQLRDGGWYVESSAPVGAYHQLLIAKR